MYPEPSIDTTTLLVVNPCAFNSVRAASMVWDSAPVVPAAAASWPRLLETR
jgi:hypothetical protein